MLPRKNVCLLLFASLAVMTAAGLSAVVFGQAPALPVPSSNAAPSGDASEPTAEPPSAPAQTPSDVPVDAANVAPAEGVSRTVTTVISAKEPGSAPRVHLQRSVSTDRSFRPPAPGNSAGLSVTIPGGRVGDYYGASSYSGAPGYGAPPYATRGIYGPHVREADPELAKLLQQDAEMEQQAAQLAQAYRTQSDESKRAETRRELEELAKQHFDLRQQRRQHEVAQLEKQLERIRSAIEKRTQAKDLIIQRHLAKLLGEEDDLAF